jgi:hypothetical protein
VKDSDGENGEGREEFGDSRRSEGRQSGEVVETSGLVEEERSELEEGERGRAEG